MITAIRHTGIVVNDLDAAISFWTGPMGFVIERHMNESGSFIDTMIGMEGVDVTTVKMRAPDGGMIELLRFKSHPDKAIWNGAPYTTGLTHIAFTVNDIESFCGRLATAGVTFPAKPQISPDGNVKVIYAHGPEGLLIELVEVLSK